MPKNMPKNNSTNLRRLYWEYICILGNLDYCTQIEIQPLSYTDFKKTKRKEEIIDLYKNILYNNS